MSSNERAMKILPALTFVIAAMALSACTTSTPLRTVPRVDLDRFMGDWYVIANIPTFIERKAYNAIESYERVDEKKIATSFRFNKGSFDGPVKTFRPTGFVKENPSNAIWGMQFIWPFKADYRVIYLNEDYTQTVIGRNKRDYVWVMARTPVIPDADYDMIIDLIAKQGYDPVKIRLVPHHHDQGRDQ
jgi:apolipoprotein D and lipocalin family protein